MGDWAMNSPTDSSAVVMLEMDVCHPASASSAPPRGAILKYTSRCSSRSHRQHEASYWCLVPGRPKT
jgi:hypothetical protein